MEIAAKVTSKGQITVPKAVRDALGIDVGDSVVFRVDGNRAIVARTPEFLSLAGSFSVPAEVRGRPWAEVRQMSRTGLVASAEGDRVGGDDG